MNSLETGRLILRKWELSDSKDLFEYAQSELVGPNAGWKPHRSEKESKEIIKKFIEENDEFAIELKTENKVIGSIGLHKRCPDENKSHLNQREIGYVLNPKYWGNGYIPEAVRFLLTYGFQELNLDVIWCAHSDFNKNSKRVIEKCGFKYQFSKEKVLILLDDKKITTLYYNIYNNKLLN